ncbi:MAG TPA: hypothetical protein HPQ04_05650 [Rhodospirillaceae bacterium]|nr:hypothetical protein [Rhodospirillaceae bacterium]
MFGATLTYLTMDWLDWAMAAAGAMVGLVFAVKAFAGLDLLTPQSSLSVLQAALLLSLLAFLGCFIADQHWPVRTMVYLVNAVSSQLDVSIQGIKGCLPSKSFTVLTWREDPPKLLIFRDQKMGREIHVPIGLGNWVANPSDSKISADFDGGRSLNQSTVMVDNEYLIRVNVDIGRVYRLFSTMAMDRVYSPDGDVSPVFLSTSCGPSSGRSVEAQ